MWQISYPPANGASLGSFFDTIYGIFSFSYICYLPTRFARRGIKFFIKKFRQFNFLPFVLSAKIVPHFSVTIVPFNFSNLAICSFISFVFFPSYVCSIISFCFFFLCPVKKSFLWHFFRLRFNLLSSLMVSKNVN